MDRFSILHLKKFDDRNVEGTSLRVGIERVFIFDVSLLFQLTA